MSSHPFQRKTNIETERVCSYFIFRFDEQSFPIVVMCIDFKLKKHIPRIEYELYKMKFNILNHIIIIECIAMHCIGIWLKPSIHPLFISFLINVTRCNVYLFSQKSSIFVCVGAHSGFKTTKFK